MFGIKGRLIFVFGCLMGLMVLLCSCSGVVQVSVEIVNEHTGTIFFTVYNASGQPLKVYTGVAMQPGGTTKISVNHSEGYYLQFIANIVGFNYIWNEEIGGVETHNIPWVNGKTYYIGDPANGEWHKIM